LRNSPDWLSVKAVLCQSSQYFLSTPGCTKFLAQLMNNEYERFLLKKKVCVYCVCISLLVVERCPEIYLKFSNRISQN